jgi:hypothetical protein
MKNTRKNFNLIMFKALLATVLAVPLALLAMQGSAAADTLTGTYEISYIYNSMDGGGQYGPHNPEGVQYYAGTPTAPILVTLEPGAHYVKIIHGLENGNAAYSGYGYVNNYWWLVQDNNPGATYPETGYDGGNTNPVGNYGMWWHGAAIWVGTSTAATDGVYTLLSGLDNTATFVIIEGQSIWLYWPDWVIIDNLGGATAEVWKVVIPVAIDIKPGSDPNCFNNDGTGVIPVAILGSSSFDVRNIDAGSVKLKSLPVKVVGKSNEPLAHYEDANYDGYEDLVVQIEDNDRVFAVGDAAAELTGKLYDRTDIQGTDAICIVP